MARPQNGQPQDGIPGHTRLLPESPFRDTQTMSAMYHKLGRIDASRSCPTELAHLIVKAAMRDPVIAADIDNLYQRTFVSFGQPYTHQPVFFAQPQTTLPPPVPAQVPVAPMHSPHSAPRAPVAPMHSPQTTHQGAGRLKFGQTQVQPTAFSVQNPAPATTSSTSQSASQAHQLRLKEWLQKLETVLKGPSMAAPLAPARLSQGNPSFSPELANKLKQGQAQAAAAASSSSSSAARPPPPIPAPAAAAAAQPSLGTQSPAAQHEDSGSSQTARRPQMGTFRPPTTSGEEEEAAREKKRRRL
ncbi:hypothetical protein F4780DRAFT_750798, partial [Xylariomycetidae sp. FL0641]